MDLVRLVKPFHFVYVAVVVDGDLISFVGVALETKCIIETDPHKLFFHLKSHSNSCIKVTRQSVEVMKMDVSHVLVLRHLKKAISKWFNNNVILLKQSYVPLNYVPKSKAVFNIILYMLLCDL